MHNYSQIEIFLNSLDFNWQDLLEFLPVGVIFFDEYWQIKSVNNNFFDFFEDELNDTSLEGTNLFSKNILSEKLPLKNILSLREGKHFEKIISITKNDKLVYLMLKGSPIFKNGTFQGGTIVIEDYNLDEYQSLELAPSTNSLINFLDKFCNCILVLDKTGKIQASSKQESLRCEIFNHSKEENISEIIGIENKAEIINAIGKVSKSNTTQSIELNYFSDTEQIIFNSIFIPFSDKDNDIKKIVVLLREKSSTENDNLGYLCNSTELSEFKSFANVSNDALFKINLHGNITYWADNSSRIFNLSASEIQTKSIGIIFPEITQEYFENVRKTLLKEGSWEGSLTSDINSEGDIYKVKIISKVTENITDLFVYCNLLDKQKQNIVVARKEESLFFKDAVLKSNQMILQVNPQGTILFSNEKFCEKFRYGLDEIQGKLFTDLLDTEFKNSNAIENFDKLVRKNNLDIIPLVDKAGNLIEVCYNINLSSQNSEVKYFTVYCSECSLKDKLFLQTAHSLLYKFNDAVVIIYGDKVIKVNPQFCELFGSEFETDFFNISYKEIVSTSSQNQFNNFLLSNSEDELEPNITFLRNDKTEFTTDIVKICCSNNSTFSVIVIKQPGKKVVEVASKKSVIKKQFKNVGPYYWSGKIKDSKFTLDFIDQDFLDLIDYSSPELKSNPETWKNFTHPDDIEIVQNFVNQTSNLGHEPNNQMLFRIINKDGEIVWINCKSKIISSSGQNVKSIYFEINDISEWAVERNELKSIIDELDKLNTAKEKFISIISHDLKSPFTSIVGFAELILTDTTLEKDEILEFVSHIKDASLHTVDLLNGLLDLTKLQTGRIEVEPKIVNASYIAHKSVEILSGLAFQKGVALSADIDKSLYMIADDNLIFQVFNNLVANSIKFTPKHGEIKITAKELIDQQKIEFTVKDTGVGIEDEDIEKLFVLDKKFTTLGTEGERGTGLGLSLVNEIIEKHKGKIIVKSEVEKGSEFIFSLPISSPSILIVDGNQSERILYSKLLDSITKSIEILQASSEHEAFDIVKNRMPMLVIFEHDLPNMKADEFIGELLKEELIYTPGLMVLTKEYSEELHTSYREIGVEALFGKPFELAKFKKELDKFTGSID